MVAHTPLHCRIRPPRILLHSKSLTAAQSNSGSWTAGEVIAMISREIVRPRKISYNLARDRYQCTKSYPFNTSSKRRKLEETASWGQAQNSLDLLKLELGYGKVQQITIRIVTA